MVRLAMEIDQLETLSKRRAEQSLAADGAIAYFSSNVFLFS